MSRGVFPPPAEKGVMGRHLGLFSFHIIEPGWLH